MEQVLIVLDSVDQYCRNGSLLTHSSLARTRPARNALCQTAGPAFQRAEVTRSVRPAYR